MDETTEYPLLRTPISPIDQYNHFVSTYNNDPNHLQILEHLPNDLHFDFLFSSKKILHKLVFFSIFVIFSGFNIIFLLLILRDFLAMHANMRIFRKNLRKSGDPFKEMVYSPSLCQMVGKTDHVFSIEFQG